MGRKAGCLLRNGHSGFCALAADRCAELCHSVGPQTLLQSCCVATLRSEQLGVICNPTWAALQKSCYLQWFSQSLSSTAPVCIVPFPPFTSSQEPLSLNSIHAHILLQAQPNTEAWDNRWSSCFAQEPEAWLHQCGGWPGTCGGDFLPPTEQKGHWNVLPCVPAPVATRV